MHALLLTALIGCGSPDRALPRTLAPPPPTQNCVTTEVDPSDRAHHIAPYAFTEPPDAVWARLGAVVSAMPRATLVDEGPDYRHYVFTTQFLRFRDDVQLVLDRDASVIRFRSASRVGHSDLGVNRARMESIRAALDPR